MEGLTPQQQDACRQFREAISDLIQPHWSEHDVCRWMIARDFNIPQAEAMLKKSLEWRKRNGVDDILQWTPSQVLKDYYPGGLAGYDKEGYPVWIDLISYLDMKGIQYSVKKNDIVKYEARNIESVRQLMRQQSAKLGKPINQCTIIMDLALIGLHHLWTPGLQLYGEVLDMTESNFPDNLRALYIINAPRLFPMLYSIMKPFLHEETQKKIQVLGSDWKAKLHEVIDPAQLPKAWGGTKEVDGDPYCGIGIGGEIPKSLYMNNGMKDYSHLTSVTVSRGAKIKIDVNVDIPHSALKWEFKTSKYDIAFGVYKKTSAKQKLKDMQEMLPITKVNSQMVAQDGYLDCTTKGTYVVIFDNRYSWVHAKTVDYHLEVVAPALVDDKNTYVATEIPGDEKEQTQM